jgi:hypothetical protein
MVKAMPFIVGVVEPVADDPGRYRSLVRRTPAPPPFALTGFGWQAILLQAILLQAILLQAILLDGRKVFPEAPLERSETVAACGVWLE